MLTVVLFGVGDRNRMAVALDIRYRVFVHEQGLPLEEEVDEHDLSDERAVHALAYGGREPIATGRWYEAEAGCVQIGRMAVLQERRQRGAGRAVLNALVDDARRKGYGRAQLLAQLAAVPFYERAGFHPFGEQLWDGGILHQPMEALWKKDRGSAGNRTPRVDGPGAP